MIGSFSNFTKLESVVKSDRMFGKKFSFAIPILVTILSNRDRE